LDCHGIDTDLKSSASIGGSNHAADTPIIRLSSDIPLHAIGRFQTGGGKVPTRIHFIENYRNSWMISVGGVYRLNDTWSLRGGLGLERIANPQMPSAIPEYPTKAAL